MPLRNAIAEENKKLLHRLAQLDDDLEEEQNEALRHLEKSKKLQQMVSLLIAK
jgi:DNA-directed RNA polymerase subunit F